MYNNGMWEKEEFEDFVARAIIACYETNIYQEPPKTNDGRRWYLEPWQVGTRKDFEFMRRIGLYFSPGDRECIENEYWYDIDGIPNGASLAYKRDKGDLLDGKDGNSYLEILSAKRVEKFPVGVKILPSQYIAKYKLSLCFPKESGGIEIYNQYFGVNKKGEVITDNHHKKAGYMGGAVLGFHADRRYLWNVKAEEASAKATFGVYGEQIKSLFYSREIPITKTGRKRPILHWVRSHIRRIESGIDVDIEKHLRGITEFTMDGTRFTITRPVKKVRTANSEKLLK